MLSAYVLIETEVGKVAHDPRVRRAAQGATLMPGAAYRQDQEQRS
jgi:hypothetical protein